MSAIFGIFHMSGQPISLDELKRMEAALAAYGPDNGGIWHNNTVGLGQRLMRFTPEDVFERQPVTTASAQYVLVSDARIDNRAELTRELGIPQREAAEMPDSAFIMRAYERWGQDCPLHLIGAFAFAIWDNHKRQLLLVSSQMGDRPLYYYSTGQTFAFATLPKGLFALPQIDPQLDEEHLADYLVIAPPTPGSTFYKNITRLQAGCCLVVSSDGIALTRYWQPDINRVMRLSHDDEYVDAFNELFERVIADHLRSSFNVGVMMSGGFDSSTVAAVAASQLRHQGRRLATYTEVPRPGFKGAIIKGRYADETPYVLAMAEMYDNIDPHFVHSDGSFYLDEIDSHFAAANVPFRNASNRVWYEAILAKAQQHGTRILLTGTPGNLTISWDGKGLLSQLVRSGQLLRAWRESSGNSNLLRLRSVIGQGCLPLLPNPLWRTIQLMRHPASHIKYSSTPWKGYSPICSEFAKQHRVTERARDKGWDFLFRTRIDPRINRRATLELMDSYGLGNNSIAYSMLFGIDLRDPTGDSRMVDFCLSLPEEQCLRNGTPRWLLQRAMASRLPRTILDNRLRGLQAAGWYETFLHAQPLIHEELACLKKSPLVSSILDLDRMQTLMDTVDIAIVGPRDMGRISSDYRGLMEVGIMTGRFIRWIEAGAAC